MVKKNQLMKDKKLDEIFSQAYFNTMAEVEKLEKKKNIEDRISVLGELFEKDLMNRDLTSAEQKTFVKTFHHFISDANEKFEVQQQTRKKMILTGLISALSVLVVSGLIYLNTYHPFTPMKDIEKQLNHYYQKVDSGYGGYAEKFYSTLDKYDLKLGEIKTEAYQQLMYQELDEHFQEYIQRLEKGEISLYDDAKQWAEFFPEEEEIETRLEAVDNAFGKGMKKTLIEGMDELADEAGSIIHRAWKFFKKEVISVIK